MHFQFKFAGRTYQVVGHTVQFGGVAIGTFYPELNYDENTYAGAAQKAYRELPASRDSQERQWSPSGCKVIFVYL